MESARNQVCQAMPFDLMQNEFGFLLKLMKRIAELPGLESLLLHLTNQAAWRADPSFVDTWQTSHGSTSRACSAFLQTNATQNTNS